MDEIRKLIEELESRCQPGEKIRWQVCQGTMRQRSLSIYIRLAIVPADLHDLLQRSIEA